MSNEQSSALPRGATAPTNDKLTGTHTADSGAVQTSTSASLRELARGLRLADEDWAAEELLAEVPRIDAALEALAFAEGAILDAIGLEDGLDGRAGESVLAMIRAALVANGKEPITIPPEGQPDAAYLCMDDRLAALLAAPVEAPPVVPVDRTVRLQRWRLLPDEPWMEKSISGEWVEFKQVSALLSAPSVSPASVQAPDEATSSPEERCTTCGFTFQCCRIGGCGMQTETPRPVEAPPPPWRELRERLVARAMRGMASADNENYACLSLTVAEWRELDALLSVPSAAAPREGHGLLEPLKAACDRSWSDETPEQIVAIAANALYWRDQEIARLKAALADAPQAQGWQPIETADAPRGGSRDYVLVALIVRGVVHRVSEAAFNGVGWYDKGGKACHWRTHWMPLPPAPAVDPIASVTPEGQKDKEHE